jgi:hypothetical protein
MLVGDAIASGPQLGNDAVSISHLPEALMIANVLDRQTTLRVAALLLFVALVAGIATSARGLDRDESWAPAGVPYAIPKSVFESLVSFKVKRYRPIRGINFNQEGGNEPVAYETLTFVQTTLRGQLALIPTARTRLVPLTDRVAMLMFPIYLCAKCGKKSVPDWLYVPADANNKDLEAPPGTGTKLFQVLFYDRIANKELGKPEGFPLEWNRWDQRDSSGNDWKQVLEPSEPTPVRGCPSCVVLVIPMEEDHEIHGHLFAFAYEFEKALVSKPFLVGSIRFSNNGQGAEVGVGMEDFHRDSRGILAHRSTESNLKTPLFGILPGKHEEDLVLLWLHEGAQK